MRAFVLAMARPRPISDRSAYAAAIALIRQFGDEAVLEAARRADVLYRAEDRNEQLAWIRIGEAAYTLLRHRAHDEPVN
jgi:hypothetical protein